MRQSNTKILRTPNEGSRSNHHECLLSVFFLAVIAGRHPDPKKKQWQDQRRDDLRPKTKRQRCDCSFCKNKAKTSTSVVFPVTLRTDRLRALLRNCCHYCCFGVCPLQQPTKRNVSNANASSNKTQTGKKRPDPPSAPLMHRASFPLRFLHDPTPPPPPPPRAYPLVDVVVQLLEQLVLAHHLVGAAVNDAQDEHQQPPSRPALPLQDLPRVLAVVLQRVTEAITAAAGAEAEAAAVVMWARGQSCI